MILKREGFKGQRAIVIPQIILDNLSSGMWTKLLYVTDIGYYPVALHHFRERTMGSPQFILIYCIEGEGFIEISGLQRKMMKNQFIVIPAGKPHKYGSIDSNPWTIHWAHFTGELAKYFVPENPDINNLRPKENTRNDRRIRLFEEIYQTLSMGFSRENLEYTSLCLLYLLGTFKYITQFERIRVVNQHNLIEKSISYMQDNIHKRITLKDIAWHCSLSISQYSRIFKEKTHCTPMNYYNNLRIQTACQMLDHTDMNIKEVAYDLNFEEQFYFSRIFKKTMGSSPNEYRKRKKV